MKPSQIRCPRCFAPRGVACVTENGVERPLHAERLELAVQRTSEAIEAGVEVPEVRSARFEENENIEVPIDSAEALAEMAVEQLREVIDSAEVDEVTGALVIYART